MDNAKDGGRVNQPVQALPIPAHAPDHGFGRGGAEGDEDQQGNEADADVGPLKQLLADGRPAEREQQRHPDEKVEAGVEQREQSHHAPHPDEFDPSAELAQRREAEGDQQKAQCPLAGGGGEFLNRVGAEVVAGDAPDQPSQWQQRQAEDRGFQRPGPGPRGGANSFRHANCFNELPDRMTLINSTEPNPGPCRGAPPVPHSR